jgi:hypothetical protein
MIWVQGPKDTAGNETVDQVAKLGSQSLLIGPETACGISAGIAMKAVGDRTETIKTTQSP